MKFRVFTWIFGLVFWLGAVGMAYGADNAQFISQSVPNLMVPGQVYPVSITMQNTGNTTWSAGNAINLGSQNPQDNTTWGMNRVIIPSGNSVTPGANYTFTFNVTAPTATGNYNFQWKMVHDGVAWFGASSTNVVVADNGANNAQFVSQAVPNSMVPSQSYAVSITMQNTGTTTWTAGTYYLGSQNTQDNTSWGLNRVNLANAVAPGTSITLSFNVTAPTSAGSYNFQWQMTQNGTRFGSASTNVAVSVQVAQNPEVSGLLFIHTDHLNTPRAITNATSQVVWRWDHAEPFGSYPANENPAGLGAFVFNLRLPGQYFDKETNAHYNMMRDYDAAIGRYIQPEPLGLAGDINLYRYARNNPLTYFDPDGRQATSQIAPQSPVTSPVPAKTQPRDPTQACPEGQQRVTDWTCVTGRALIWSPTYIAFACVGLASPRLGPVLGPLGFIGSAGFVSAIAYYDNYLLCSTCVDYRKPPGR